MEGQLLDIMDLLQDVKCKFIAFVFQGEQGLSQEYYKLVSLHLIILS